MPRENKKRGRRAEEQKRKREASGSGSGICNVKRKRTVNGSPLTQKQSERGENGSASPSQQSWHGQRHRYDDHAWTRDTLDHYAHYEQHGNHDYGTLDKDEEQYLKQAYYGTLDEDEEQYFKQAYDVLKANAFPSDEERQLFIDNVYREAEGKELKLACSQSCSRMLEGLILASKASQLKQLFHKFSTQFSYLVQHLFASHCCEKLFLASAAVVRDEMKKKKWEGSSSTPVQPVQSEIGDEAGLSKPADGEAAEEPDVSTESLVLSALQELQDQLADHVVHKSASHCVRVLLAILAGEPLPNPDESTSNKKRRVEKESKGASQSARTPSSLTKVPASFTTALAGVIDRFASLDTVYLRDLALHETGSPCLLLLLRLELSRFGKERAKDEHSIIRKLLPDDPVAEGSSSALFVKALMSNRAGSFLLEEVLQLCPGKMFKGIYRDIFKDHLHTLAKDEVSAYIVARVLERLGKDDLNEAMNTIVPEIPKLVKRDRTLIIRILVERCVSRGVDHTPLAMQIQAAYSGPKGFELTRLLKLDHVSRSSGSGGSKSKSTQKDLDTASKDPKNINNEAYASHKPPLSSSSLPLTTSSSSSSSTTPSQKHHASQLARTMIDVPGMLSEMIFSSFVRMGAPLALVIARDSAASQALQAALISSNASVIFRRKMIQQFYGHVGELALDPSGSHVIDAIWHGTHGLAFIRERIAEELAENEAALRQSLVGRAVWRNWRMVLYRRRRAEWVRMSREMVGSQRFTPFPDGIGGGKVSGIAAGSAGGRKGEGGNGSGNGSGNAGGNAAGYAKVDARERGANMIRFANASRNEKENDGGKSAIHMARARHAANRAAGGGGTHRSTPVVSSAVADC